MISLIRKSKDYDSEKIKAIKLYYHMHKCTLVEARDHVEQLKTQMKERGEL